MLGRVPTAPFAMIIPPPIPPGRVGWWPILGGVPAPFPCPSRCPCLFPAPHPVSAFALPLPCAASP